MNGKSELRTPLGADYRIAARKLPGAVAGLMNEIALAERRAGAATGKPVVVGRYPLSPEQIAHANYQSRLAFDEELRNTDPRYANMEIDDELAAAYREGITGRLADDQLQSLVGSRIDHYRRIGNTTAEKGSDDWRTLARAMCISEYEALARAAERHDGDFTGKPSHPMLATETVVPEPQRPIKLTSLLDDYLNERAADGKGKEARRRWTPVFADLVKFIGHNDARRLTKQNVLDWKDARLKTLATKTVADVYLSSLRTVLTWAVDNDRLESNVAVRVRVLVSRKEATREKGFTLPEATIVLRVARDYVPVQSNNPKTREASGTTAAKRWSPVLCAFSGARIAEITQLRKEDFRDEAGATIMRITPAAGTVKAGGYRDVPVHPQIIEMGFLDFVAASPNGPLFYTGKPGQDSIAAARTVAGRVSEWLQSLNVVPEGVKPSHGWRHRFKTVGGELGISDRAIDAIQGHAAKTAGDNYGDVTLITRWAAIERFPRYELDQV